MSSFPHVLEEIGVRFLVTSHSTSTVVLGVLGNFGTKTDLTCYGLLRSFYSVFHSKILSISITTNPVQRSFEFWHYLTHNSYNLDLLEHYTSSLFSIVYWVLPDPWEVLAHWSRILLLVYLPLLEYSKHINLGYLLITFSSFVVLFNRVVLLLLTERRNTLYWGFLVK